MRLLVCFVATSCALPEPGAEVSHPVAIQVPDGLAVLDDRQRDDAIDGLPGMQTFCWDRRGQGFYLTTGGEMSWIPRAGGEIQTIVAGFRAVRFPDVSDRGVIAFSATQEEGAGEGWEIWLVNEDGSGLRRLAAGYDPSWSADGLYFEHYDPVAGLYFHDVTTGAVRPVLEPGGGDYTVECSPSGRYLAFSRRGALMLHTIADGLTRALTDGSTYDRFASFSPDEREIVFYRQTSDGESRNWLVHYDLATGEERQTPVELQVTPAYIPRIR